jgi:hypothetical protein
MTIPGCGNLNIKKQSLKAEYDHEDFEMRLNSAIEALTLNKIRK